MSIKSKVFAAAAATALVTGAGALAAGSANAATPPCGSSCLDLFARDFGTHKTPNFVMDVYQQAAKAGQKIILFKGSDTDPAEDFNTTFQGVVSDFYDAGMVSAALNLHYGDGSVASVDDPAFETEYAPYGVDSGLCVGLASTAIQDEAVTLQPCGVSASTVWVVDTADSPTTLSNGYVPLINGTDTNFSHPFVLTYPSNGYPTDTPRPQVEVANITGFTGSTIFPTFGTVDDTQLWGADFGILK